MSHQGQGGGLVPWIVLGNPKGKPLVFLRFIIVNECNYFCLLVLVRASGFPDNCISAWGPVIDNLKQDYLIIALCMPGFVEYFISLLLHLILK